MIVGQYIEVLDANEVYCPCIIRSIEGDSVLISYLGWEADWDITLSFQSPRISLESKTVIAKAWIKLTSKKPIYWPCKVYIRHPMVNSVIGEQYLKTESRMYIIPYGPMCSLLKPYKHGVWLNASKLSYFKSKSYDKKVNEGLSSAYSSIFKQALDECNSDLNSVSVRFKLDGTYDTEHKQIELKRLADEDKANREAAKRELLNIQTQLTSTTHGNRNANTSTASSSSTLPSIPKSSPYYNISKMIKVNMSELHPAGADSVRQVIEVLRSQGQTMGQGENNGLIRDTSFSSAAVVVSERVENKSLFPFKISQLTQYTQSTAPTTTTTTTTASTTTSLPVSHGGTKGASLTTAGGKKRSRLINDDELITGKKGHNYDTFTALSGVVGEAVVSTASTTITTTTTTSSSSSSSTMSNRKSSNRRKPINPKCILII